MGIQINGQTDTISASDGSLSIAGQELTGVTDINASGIITATSFSGDGSGLTGVGIGTDGSVNTTGIITATTFSGDGSSLTGVGGGSSITSGNTSAEVIDTGSDGRFVVTTEGTERLRVTDTGLVGIGISSPSSNLHVIGGATSGGVDTAAIFKGGSGSGGGVRICLSSVAGFETTRGAYIEAVNEASGNDHSLRFATNSASASPVERARIDASGRLLVGVSTAADSSYKVQIGGHLDSTVRTNTLALYGYQTNQASGSIINQIIFGPSAYSGAGGAKISQIKGSDNQSDSLAFFTGSTSLSERMRIGSNGILIKYGDSSTARILPQTDNAGYIGESNKRWQAIYAVNGTIQTSDVREKTDIIDSPLGADFIRSLRPVAYKWKIGGYTSTYDDEGKETITPNPGVRTHYGFIAQEVKQATGSTDFGGWLQEDLDDPESKQSLRLHEFISPIVKALQEALDEIDNLKVEVAVLKAQ